MTTQEVANKLVEYCRKGEFDAAQKELYADDAISIEPYATEDFAKETKGKKALYDKSVKFGSMVQEMHSVSISDPLVAGNTFAFVMTMDATMKTKGRFKMDELCVYEVKDGKVISEHFFI